MKLSRNAKIQKLANAIYGYRGRYSLEEQRWTQRPRPTEGKRVVDWLVRLKLNVEESIKTIQGFQTTGDMDAWLKTL